MWMLQGLMREETCHETALSIDANDTPRNAINLMAFPQPHVLVPPQIQDSRPQRLTQVKETPCRIPSFAILTRASSLRNSKLG
jgi:hypothetical protein